ncbi:hypothetical protein QBC47DRAFT_50114 [Echria macrotheca]|uniref:Uncharacterized protein n=1 Tax=Echria macrotheca TaxID=438768 RepID=A0AAJ0B768_9PEZI|nr:hypothetical protein QBC47DRAFT_50114 [Echria macrotheca]
MSGLGWNTRLLGRCAPCLRANALTVARSNRVVVRSSHRPASTATKPRAKKTPAPSGEDVVSIPKKSLSTKSPAVPSTKTPRRKTEPTEAAEATPTPKKSTRAASTKSSAAAKKKAEAVVEPSADAASTPRKASVRSVKAAPIREAVSSGRPAGADTPPVSPQKPVDVKSAEYKSASRKWTSLMVGLPLLIVSSYFLYDRLILGNEPKTPDSAPAPPPADEVKQSEA